MATVFIHADDDGVRHHTSARRTSSGNLIAVTARTDSDILHLFLSDRLAHELAVQLMEALDEDS